MQCVAQEAAAHAGGAGVKQREQGGRCFAADGFRNLEVAPCGRIDAEIGRTVFHRQAGHVRDRIALRGARVFDQRAGSANGGGQGFNAEGGKVVRDELAGQDASRGVVVELPDRQTLDGKGRIISKRWRRRIAYQHLGRSQAFEFTGQLFAGGDRCAHTAGGE